MTGGHYILTLVDDHSRATWTFLLANKQLVPFTLACFLSQIETRFHKKVKIMRSDNGTIFINSDCQHLFEIGE